MDGLKLHKWRENFSLQVQNLLIEYNAFFLNRKLEEYYELTINEDSQNLSLEISGKDTLPKEIQDRLMEIFLNTKPEDSI